MTRTALLSTIAGVAMLANVLPALAAETGGCNSFAWAITTELKWMKDPDSEAVKSGAKLPQPPGKAMTLALEPMSAVSFPVAPTGRYKPPGEAFGGIVTFDSPSGAPGAYQFSLQTPGWIDIIQDGKALKSTAHSGKSDCDGVRKSIRFNLNPGPFTVEISNINKDAIKFTIRQAE